MWSKKHSQCFKCTTISIPHGGMGLCIKCYKSWYSIEYREELNGNKRSYKKRNRLIVLSRENKRARKSKSRSEYVLTNVYKGIQAEKDALYILKGSIRVNKRFKKEQPYDLEWKDKRINVKSARMRGYKYTFGLLGTQANCDYLLCIGYISNKITKVWLIPSNIFPSHKNSVAFGYVSSKFDKYLYH